MLLKGMLVFSGAGAQTAHRFQIGAAGTGNDMEPYAEQFEEMGACVAQTALKLFRQ